MSAAARRTVAILVGTRPEAIKLAPVVCAAREHPLFDPVVISTGQHREMLRQVLELFDIEPDVELDVMRPDQGLGPLTASLVRALDAELPRHRAGLCLVQGDTTTAFAGALVAFYHGVRVGHVEAGLRTHDLRSPFPEEANRKLVSALAHLHFAPTEGARQNLLAEGVDPGSIAVTGNTVVDALHLELAAQERGEVRADVQRFLTDAVGSDWAERPTVLVTGHRRENFGRGFAQICDALDELAARLSDFRFVYPVHLNPRVRGPVHERLGDRPNLLLLPPLGYRPFVALLGACRFVLTDSGGIQEEAPSLGKPVLVMRDTTERPEGVAAGTVRLVGAERGAIVAAVRELVEDEAAYRRMAEAVNPYGDGRATERILERILELDDT